MKKIGKIILFALIIILISGAGIVYYSFYIEPNRLVVHDYELTYQTTSTTEELNIVQISDIHMSDSFNLEHLDKLVDKVNEQQADLILFTGDLFDIYNSYPNHEAVSERLAKLKSTYGKYAIWGNRDYGGGASRIYEDSMITAGFTILRNESTLLSIKGKQILLQGLDDVLMGAPDVASLRSEEPVDYRILMVHEPDIADEYKDESVDLFLAGHSHGGQIRIPFYDIIHTSMAQKYKRGMYTVNEETGSKIYVNTGLGTTKIRARLGVPPEIAVFHLK